MNTKTWWMGPLMLLAAVVVIIWLEVADQRQWDGYAAAHHCVKAGVKSGQAVTSFDSKGRLVVGVESDQTIYRCDNEEIRIR